MREIIEKRMMMTMPRTIIALRMKEVILMTRVPRKNSLTHRNPMIKQQLYVLPLPGPVSLYDCRETRDRVTRQRIERETLTHRCVIHWVSVMSESELSDNIPRLCLSNIMNVWVIEWEMITS